MFYRKVLRPIVQLSRWPWYIWDVRSRPPSQWSNRTRRYIGIADTLRSPRMNILLELAEKAANLPGDMAECGVFQGHTAIALGLFIREHSLDKKMYALDSYEGFDEVADKEAEASYMRTGVTHPIMKKGTFAGTSMELIHHKIRKTDLSGIVIPVKGYFRMTLPTLPARHYCFVHLDCDLGESYRECLDYFYSRVAPGGYICFDEYRDDNWPMATQAIDEFFRDKLEKPVAVFRMFQGKPLSRWHVRKGSIR